ncbi:MAG: TonB-dependent siderophore receptor [Pseudomonadaceae bacterium]|nr:TonB-dependent siderophore receptor [Pseudomonadaceae bacterium]
MLLALFSQVPSWQSAQAAEPVATVLDSVVIDASQDSTSAQLDSYSSAPSGTATKLNLSARETPQSVSTITRGQLDDFQLTSVTEALKYTPGITVEQVETDRTYFSARGFDINNFQYDGIGLPFANDSLAGDADTALFERIEVLRGANGLMSGIGNPSATVNFIRKRPTAQTQAKVELTAGSWDMRRVDGDVSGSLTESGNVRGRMVYANENKNAYLDRYAREKNVFLGVLEADLSDSSLFTIGHSLQKTDADSPMWGGLPLTYTNGQATDYSRSTSTASDWSYWNNQEQRTFAELTEDLGAGWQAKLSLTRVEQKSDGNLFYMYGTPDADTDLGLLSYPSLYHGTTSQNIADLYASGPFTLAGREHELVVGGSWSKSQQRDQSYYDQSAGTALPPLQDWNGNYPRPNYDGGEGQASFTDRQKSAYTVARFSLADSLKLITGARLMNVESEGSAYGENRSTEYNGRVVPYAGLVYDLDKDYSVYASYTEIFNPQSKQDQQGKRLEALQGENYEVGIKAALLDDRLDASLAMFQTKQDNLPEVAGLTGGTTYYRALQGIESQGWEMEVAGELLAGLQVSAGYTFVDITDSAGKHQRTYAPKHLVRSSSTYRLAQMPQLKVGASVSWQSEVHNGVAEQDSYALLNLMASYELDPSWTVAANLNNLTDQKYLTSLYWDQAYYGAPRNASMSVSWKY